MSDACVVKACEACWDSHFVGEVANKDNCSGLVKAVAQRLNISMANGRADEIVTYLTNHVSWRELTSGREAKIQAETGHFVIAGLKSIEHSPAPSSGHVVIVVSGELHHGIYPKCWSGSGRLSGKSKGEKSVGQVWTRADRDNVHYYCYAQGAVCPSI